MTFRWFIFLFINFHILEAGWLDKRAEGWAWYEEEKKGKSQEDKPQESSQTPHSAKEQLDKEKMILEEKLAAALLDPSEKNIEEYMIEQKKWVDQSGQFARNWSKTILNNPGLTNSLTQVPSSNYGMQIHRSMTVQKRKQFIKNLSETHGLVFLYEGQNPISKAFSDVVKMFEKEYDWYLIPVTTDGYIFEQFPSTQIDQGLSSHLKTQIFPALYLLDSETNTYIPIAYDLTSLEQIERNILKQLDMDPEENQ